MQKQIVLYALLLWKSTLSVDASPPEHRALPQPLVPEGCTEIPFVESVAEPQLTEAEQQRGYFLFQRPITDPVYPNTHPLPRERCHELEAFAAPGEFEPLAFSIYPIRALENLRVTVSELRAGNGSTIPAKAIDTRLVTYWNMGYPRYTSRSTYRRLPELLEKVTAHSSPALECQRWWITIHVPARTPPGIYRGRITLRDDHTQAATVLPVRFRVLDFRLLSDPDKHYSAYFAPKNRTQYQGKTDEETRQMLDSEYRAMHEMGMNMIPTLHLMWDEERQKIVLQHEDELERMKLSGLAGPVPVTSGKVVRHFYQQSTPGGERRPHWNITKMPPETFYQDLKEAFENFVNENRKKGGPTFYCCPIDEVTAERKLFGAGVFQAVHDAGMKTYITKDPTAPDARFYEPFVDAWCSQPYSTPYAEIIAQDQHEYWSYPNHNAGEIKNREIQCKGGRMTYGYGFWRSGFTTLIPWHWSWVMAPDQFDYLRSRQSGCGQRLGPDGDVIPSIYWACFREGIDDGRYIYTLEQAIWEREDSPDPRCRNLAEEAKAALQSQWDDIRVQDKYLSEGLWASAEFNARRWELASYIARLLEHPPVRQGKAPSVIVQSRTKPSASILDRETQRGNIKIKDLSESFNQWTNETPEGQIETGKEFGLDGKPGLLWSVDVDYTRGEKGYPVGWPRIRCSYRPALDFTQYDYLEYQIKTDSNRNEVNDDITPTGFTIQSKHFYQTYRDLGGRQRVWVPVLFDIQKLIKNTGQGSAPWKTIDRLQLFIAEGQYQDQTQIQFQIGSLKLLRFKEPVIAELLSPKVIQLPAAQLPVQFKLLGNPGEEYKISVSLRDPAGNIVASSTQTAGSDPTLLLNTEPLAPGCYKLSAKLTNNGKTCSEKTQDLHFLAGPFSPTLKPGH